MQLAGAEETTKIVYRRSVGLCRRLAYIIEYSKEESREILVKRQGDGGTDLNMPCDAYEHCAYSKYPVSRYARAAPG